MADAKEKKSVTPPVGSNEAEKLSAPNAQTWRRKNPAQRLRRKMEASIEAKASKRRQREVPASAAWKP